VKSGPFEYHAPTSIDAAVELLAGADAESRVMVLAGGQSLVPAMAIRRVRPRHLVDINELSAVLGAVDTDGEVLTVGALVRQSDAERSAVVARQCPLLAQAIPYIAHAPIRNRGTVVGSVAFANPAAEIPAVVAALDGRIRSLGRDGARVINARDFFRGRQETALAPHELVTHVDFPLLPAGSGSCFREVSRRYGDPAIVGVAAAVTLRGEQITDARVALAGVAEVPIRASTAEGMLRGAEPTPALVMEAAGAACDDLAPPADLLASASYRRYLARVLVGESLEAAIQAARESDGG
jgi:carbon-monoxide dehydrogenase medium subunit